MVIMAGLVESNPQISGLVKVKIGMKLQHSFTRVCLFVYSGQ